MIKRLLSKLPLMNATLGDVVFETRPLQGAGPDGAVVNYIEFDIEAAERAKADLERCIAEYHQQRAAGSVKS